MTARPRRRSVALVAAGLVLAAGSLAVESPPAGGATDATAPTVVSAIPAAYTPDVRNGVVDDVGQVGSTVYIGGSFTSVTSQSGTTTAPSKYVAAFTAGTGALVTTFNPRIVGTEIDTIIPGPTSNTVYVGGTVTTIDGVATKVALLNATTGAIAPGWNAAPLNGAVNQLAVADGQLFVAGYFTKAGSTTRDGLATLNPQTGALTSYAAVAFTGHHNYGVRSGKPADGAVGLKSLAVNPAGTQLVVTGNFTRAADSTGSVARDQIAVLTLGSSASIDQTWATLSYTSPCNASSFDSYIRRVAFSPDGSYFVVAATGGASAPNSDGTSGLCDSAARFDPDATGADIAPTWVDYTGKDSLWTTAITAGAVYVGGHERWLNNSEGKDNAAEGAVPRPAVAALNPTNGLPLAWNPGRTPRGAGTYALFPSGDGLYMGSDQDWVGNYRYHREKIAFFPNAGGSPAPADTTPALPGNVYTAGSFGDDPNQLTERHFDGSTAGVEVDRSTSINWGDARGVFTVDGDVVYGKDDGKLYERSFTGAGFGPEVALDPYDDPTWDNVQTGSGQTYRGVPPDLFGTELASVTSMFFTDGRLYYTVAGQQAMHWRWFEPQSGVVGADEFTTSDGNDWSDVAGAFLSGDTLYVADKATGQLESVPWSGTQASGTPTVVATGQSDWASRGMFLLDDATYPNQSPVASFIPSCSSTSNACTFDPSSSYDPDGVITSYSWAFGDGSTEQHPDSSPVTHTYSSSTPYTATLTVTDNDGATASKSFRLTPGQPVPVPTFRGAVSSCAAGTGPCGKSAVTTVAVPAGTAAGDTLLMFVSWPNTATPVSVPAGWHLLGTDVSNPLESDVYYRAATGSDSGTTIPVTFGTATKNSVTLADYSGAASAIEAFGTSADSGTVSHPTPAVPVNDQGSLAVSYWTDKSSTTTGWRLPAGVRGDSFFYDNGSGYVTSALADSGATVGIGSYGPEVATTNAASGKGAEWTIVLAPTGTLSN